jgi:ubiquinone/menaquinone biosynthesis C-methylase UbiE
VDESERIWPTPATEAAERKVHAAEWARYEFAAAYARGLTVLDCACGAGYGSAILLRSGAARVIGVDVSDEALAHARAHWAGPEFRKSGGARLPLADGEVQLCVSLETIEHISDAKGFVDELWRVLQPGGKLVVSTPLTRGPARLKPANPYHLREYDEDELAALLTPRFRILERLGLHSAASASYAQLARTPGLGSLIRAGVHRLVPRQLRAALRSRLGAREARQAWVSAERWQEAPVQLVVAERA